MGVSRRTFLRRSAGAAATGIWGRAHAGQRTPPNAKVLVVGGGFAGSACALALRRLQPGLNVSLVDPDARYVTCPMSNSVLAGLRGLDSITVSRQGLGRAGVNYVHDRVVAIDTGPRRARLAGGGALAYDRLIVAPGIRMRWGMPEGYDEAAALIMPHAWQAGPQTQILAAQLRAIRDGGVVAISVPAGPMRCPPGPFERASLIAGFLRAHKPRAKVLIFDANNHFPRQDAFSDAWRDLYPGMIEWIPVTEDGAVVRVAPKEMTLYTAHGAHRIDVANIIPPQAPGLLALQAGLASDHGWCPINPQTFESLSVGAVHVIGDACIADPMPKSASAANAQARQCALAIVASLEGREAPAPHFDSVCYSLLAPRSALSIHGRFRVAQGLVQQIQGTQTQGTEESQPATAAQEARNADDWYRRIMQDSFGSATVAAS